MQAANTPFRPIWGTTISLPATSVTSQVAIPAAAAGATAMRIVYVLGTDGVRFRSGSATSAIAVTGDPKMIPGTVESIGINAGDTHIAVKTDSGTGTIEATFGVGF